MSKPQLWQKGPDNSMRKQRIRRHCSACRILKSSNPPLSPPLTQGFGVARPPPLPLRPRDDVPLNEVFSQTRGPRLDSPCRLFAGLGFLPPFSEKRKNSVFLDVLIAKTLEKPCFWRQILGSKARKCKEMMEEIGSRHDRKAAGHERETQEN